LDRKLNPCTVQRRRRLLEETRPRESFSFSWQVGRRKRGGGEKRGKKTMSLGCFFFFQDEKQGVIHCQCWAVRIPLRGGGGCSIVPPLFFPIVLWFTVFSASFAERKKKDEIHILSLGVPCGEKKRPGGAIPGVKKKGQGVQVYPICSWGRKGGKKLNLVTQQVKRLRHGMNLGNDSALRKKREKKKRSNLASCVVTPEKRGEKK